MRKCHNQRGSCIWLMWPNRTGQWGVSSHIVHTSGSKDTICQGLVSSSSPSNSLFLGGKTHHRDSTGLIVGLVALGVVGVCALTGSIYVIRALRRRGARRMLSKDQRATLEPWTRFTSTDPEAGSGGLPQTEPPVPVSRLFADLPEPPLGEASSVGCTYNAPSSARTTILSTRASLPPPRSRKQHEADAARAQARASMPMSSNSLQQIPYNPTDTNEISPSALRSDASPIGQAQPSEDDASQLYDLPPPYEHVSERRD